MGACVHDAEKDTKKLKNQNGGVRTKSTLTQDASTSPWEADSWTYEPYLIPLMISLRSPD
jgi:hypothetical protein